VINLKRIILSTLSIIAVVGMVSAATWARFIDTEASNNNTFATGTLDLTVDGKNGAEVKSFNVVNLKPGDIYGRVYYRLKNVGSVAGKPKICLTNLVNTESSGTTEFENDGTPGELGDNLELIVDTNGHWLMTSGQKLDAFNGRCWTPDDPKDAEFAASNADVLDPGEEMIFGIRLDLPVNAGNEIQGDSVSFDLEFTLEQI